MKRAVTAMNVVSLFFVSRGFEKNVLKLSCVVFSVCLLDYALHFCLIFCTLNFLFSAYHLLRNVFRSPSMTVDLFFLTVLVKFVLRALWLLVEGTIRLHMSLSSKQNLTVMSWPPSSLGLRSDEFSKT